MAERLPGGADKRPRIHLYLNRYGWEASVGPNGHRFRGSLTLGEALEAAYRSIDPAKMKQGFVAIGEPIDA